MYSCVLRGESRIIWKTNIWWRIRSRGSEVIEKKKNYLSFPHFQWQGCIFMHGFGVCLSLKGFSVVRWNLQLSFYFLFRGLKALGVRDLTYRLAFLACSVQATNPRVRHFSYYFCFVNYIYIRKPQNTCLRNEDLGLLCLKIVFML